MPLFHFRGRMSQSYRSILQRLKRNPKVAGTRLHPDSFELSSISVNSSSEDAQSQPPRPVTSNSSIPEQEDQGEETGSVPHPRSHTTFAEPFLSHKLCQLSEYGVNVGSWAGVHAYFWNANEKSMTIRNLKFSQSGWWFGIWLIVTFFLFQIVQLIIRITDYEGLDFEKLVLLYSMAITILPLVFQVVAKVHRDLLKGFANRTVRFCYDYSQLFDDDLRETATPELKIAEIFLQSAYFGLGLLCFLITCLAIAKPDLCTFFSSWCIDPISSCHIPVYIIGMGTLIVLEFLSFAWCALYAVGLALVLCMSPTIWHLNILHAKRDRYGPRQLLYIYMQMCLLFEELNQIMSMLLLPTGENVLVTLTVFGLHGALRTSGVLCTLMFAVACVAFTCLMLFFWALGKIHSASSQLLGTWKRDLRFSRRELRSVREIRIRLGTYGYVDAGIILTLIDVIFTYSITLLITN